MVEMLTDFELSWVKVRTSPFLSIITIRLQEGLSYTCISSTILTGNSCKQGVIFCLFAVDVGVLSCYYDKLDIKKNKLYLSLHKN